MTLSRLYISQHRDNSRNFNDLNKYSTVSIKRIIGKQIRTLYSMNYVPRPQRMPGSLHFLYTHSMSKLEFTLRTLRLNSGQR